MTAFISDNTPFVYSISRQANNTGNNDVYSCSVNLNTGLIAPAICSIQQSNSSINNAADAIVI